MDVPTNTIMDTNGKRRRNKRWPEALKREIVAATFVSGASVSVIARRYDVNVNQVFGWRHRFGPSIAAVPATSPSPRPSLVAPSLVAPRLVAPRLVAVTLGPAPAEPPLEPPLASAARIGCDLIEIEVCGMYRVRVGANFDGRALQRLLDVLVRR